MAKLRIPPPLGWLVGLWLGAWLLLPTPTENPGDLKGWGEFVTYLASHPELRAPPDCAPFLSARNPDVAMKGDGDPQQARRLCETVISAYHNDGWHRYAVVKRRGTLQLGTITAGLVHGKALPLAFYALLLVVVIAPAMSPHFSAEQVLGLFVAGSVLGYVVEGLYSEVPVAGARLGVTAVLAAHLRQHRGGETPILGFNDTLTTYAAQWWHLALGWGVLCLTIDGLSHPSSPSWLGVLSAAAVGAGVSEYRLRSEKPADETQLAAAEARRALAALVETGADALQSSLPAATEPTNSPSSSPPSELSSDVELPPEPLTPLADLVLPSLGGTSSGGAPREDNGPAASSSIAGQRASAEAVHQQDTEVLSRRRATEEPPLKQPDLHQQDTDVFDRATAPVSDAERDAWAFDADPQPDRATPSSDGISASAEVEESDSESPRGSTQENASAQSATEASSPPEGDAIASLLAAFERAQAESEAARAEMAATPSMDSSSREARDAPGHEAGGHRATEDPEQFKSMPPAAQEGARLGAAESSIAGEHTLAYLQTNAQRSPVADAAQAPHTPRHSARVSRPTEDGYAALLDDERHAILRPEDVISVVIGRLRAAPQSPAHAVVALRRAGQPEAWHLPLSGLNLRTLGGPESGGFEAWRYFMQQISARGRRLPEQADWPTLPLPEFETLEAMFAQAEGLIGD